MDLEATSPTTHPYGIAKHHTACLLKLKKQDTSWIDSNEPPAGSSERLTEKRV